MTEILVTSIASLPPTIAALAAWRNARAANAQTNGSLHEPLAEMRGDIADLKADMRDLKAEMRELKGGR